MAKRFTDTDKWKKTLLKSMPAAYKLLWLYVCDDCDHAGIWHVDIDVAALRIGEEISEEKAIEVFGNKVVVFDGGDKWFIPGFIDFQYGELNPKNRVHESIIKILSKYKLSENKPLTSPLQGAKDKDMDKDTEEILERGAGENLLPLGYRMQQEFLEVNPGYPSRPSHDCPAIITIGEFIHQQRTGAEKNIFEMDVGEQDQVFNEWQKWCRWYKDRGSNKSLENLVKFKMQEIYSEIKNSKKNGTHQSDHRPFKPGKSAGANELLSQLQQDIGAGG